MKRRACGALVAALVTTSCAVPMMKLPTGPATPAADAADAFAQATDACRGVLTFSAEVGLSGRVGGRRARGRLLAGVAAPASVYLDAPAPFGASVFIFAAVGDQATLLLPRDRRVLERGDPAEVLEAVAGVALTPAEVRETLTGCASQAADAAANAFGENWRVIPGASSVYLRRDRPADPWRVVAAVHPGWRAEYRDFSEGMPRTIRLIGDGPSRFDLRLSLSQVEVNVPLEESVFRPAVPQGYAPVTLDEVRDAGPLAEPSR